MSLRPWADVAYLPILAMKPAEMRALEELPGQTKDALLPVIPLKPWVGSHHLASTIDRIKKSYGARPVVVSVGERETGKDRTVFAELDRLRESDDGFANWCEFVASHPNYIPVAQLSLDSSQERQQIEQLYALRRGLVLHLERPALGALAPISKIVRDVTVDGNDVCFIIDFGVASADILQDASRALDYIRTLREQCPNAYVSISASSFPNGFKDRIEQPIYERSLFELIVNNLGSDKLIYSDRGSARAEPLAGGSGVIPARIDYPLFDGWKFYRSDDAGFDGYVEQAKVLIASGDWNSNLRVWGTQMIERTARGDHSAIDSPSKSTAARINLHLQLQTFYKKVDEAEDTEEDWNG